MKKKIRKTGEVVDIVSFSCFCERNETDCVSYIDSKGEEHENIRGLNYYWDFDNVEEEPAIIDWEQRRYEIAKSAMNGVLCNPAFCNTSTNKDLPIKIAIYSADKLIEELKKEK